MLAACQDTRPTPLGEVYAGPLNLPLHSEINPKSKVVVTAHHGDKLGIVQQRRRLYRVRTRDNREGWTDERNLMSVPQMDALRRLEARARRFPSQGVAGTYEQLNVHTEPQRFSPSFVQIDPGEKFDVIGHQAAARTEPAHRVLVKPQPSTQGNGRKASRVDRKKLVLLPPIPPPPPRDWRELSRERSQPQPEPERIPKKGKDLPVEPAPVDDWTLVRTGKGSAGWVLTSRIFLAIPDEVAQYAEGHRIVTYFSVGKIHDDELNVDKDFWLWTTIHAGNFPFDFDSYRVFTWNPKRHRYETAYIQRSVEGYLPVLIGKGDFSVCVAQDDGTRVRKRYVFLERQVRAADVQPCRETDVESKLMNSTDEAAPPAGAPSSLGDRLKGRAGELKKRIFGK